MNLPECAFCPDPILPHEPAAVDCDKRPCHAECLAEANRQADDCRASDLAEPFWGAK